MKKIFLALSLILCMQSMNAMTGWIAAKIAVHSVLLYGLVEGAYIFYREAESMRPVIKAAKEKLKDRKVFRTYFGTCYTVQGDEIIATRNAGEMIHCAIAEGLNANLPLDQQQKNPYAETEDYIKMYQDACGIGFYLCAGLAFLPAYALSSIITPLIK